jgi:hypothetical protein
VRTTVLRSVVLAGLLAALPLARADGDATARRIAILQSLEAPEGAVARTWPGAPGRLLVGWTVMRPDSDDDANSPLRHVDLTLVLVQTSTARVLARTTFPAVWQSDAIEFRAIELDTAAWTLAAGQRAFGVRAYFAHPGRLTVSSETRLSLFDVRGSTIAPVLSHLLVDETIESGQCGVYRRRHVTLAVASTRSHGHADLALDAKGMDAKDARAEPPSTCPDEVKREWKGVLRYDGTRYVIPTAIDGLP